MKVFVTGANGFIGSHLSEALARRGDDVVGLVEPGNTNPWLTDAHIPFIVDDIRRPGAEVVEAVKDADAIYHLAGARVALTEKKFAETNVGGTRALLELCAQHNTRLHRFVLVSSATVTGPADDGEFPTEEKTNPIGPYARTKLQAEELAFGEYGERLPITVIRPSAVYGPRTTELTALLQAIVRWRIQMVMGVFRNSLIDWCHVSDLVNGLLLAIDRDEAVGEIFHIGGFHHYWKDLGKAFGDALGMKSFTVRVPDLVLYACAGAAHLAGFVIGRSFELNWWRARDFTQKNWVFSSDKARRVLGYEPKMDFLRVGARTTAEWFLENGWVKPWTRRSKLLAPAPEENQLPPPRDEA